MSACTDPGCRGCQPVVMPDGQITYYCPSIRVTLLCTVRRVDPKPDCPGVRADPPKPRQGVTPKKPAEKPTTTKVTEKPGRKRPGGQAKPRVVATPAPPKVSKRPKVSRPGVGVGQALNGLGHAAITAGAVLFGLVVLGLLLELAGVVAAVVAVIVAWLPLILTVAALGVAGYIATRTVPDVDWAPLSRRVWFACAHVAEWRLERKRAHAVAQATAAIPLGPVGNVADSADQEWIARGLRNRRLDGYVAEPVRVDRTGAA